MLGHACSHRPLGVLCLVPLVVGEEFGKRNRLVVVHLDRSIQDAVVRLEVQPRPVTALEYLSVGLQRRGQ